MKILSHPWIKGRTAADEETQPGAECAMDLSEQKFSQIKSQETARIAIQQQRGAKEQTHHGRLLVQLFQDPAVEEVEKLRYCGQDRDAGLLERLQNLAPLERIDESDLRAHRKRRKHIHHGRKDMLQRKHTEKGVLVVAVDDPQNPGNLAEDVLVGQHHSFRFACGSGSVNDESDTLDPGRRQFRSGIQGAGPAHEISEQSPSVLFSRTGIEAGPLLAQRGVCNGLLEPGKVHSTDEDPYRARVLQQLTPLGRRYLWIQGNHRRPRY